MTATAVKDLREQMVGALTKARDLAALAEQEDREFTAEERGQVEGWVTEAAKAKAALKQADADADIRNQIAALGQGIDFQGGSTNPQLTPVQGKLWTPGKTLGDRFIESKGFQAWLDSVRVGDYIPESTKGLKSPPVQFTNLITGLDSSSAGAFVLPDEQPYVSLGQRPLELRNVVTNGTTGSDTVHFVRELTRTNNAAPVAEATATSGSSGVKPESTFTFEEVTETVKTIAHWVAATKRALSDVGQLRTLIDNFLRDGLEQELEDQIATGAGTGQNFTGISNTSGIQSQAWDTDFFTTTRKAKTKVRTIGRATPNAYLMNPYDAEKLELTQDNEGRYYYGGPAQDAGPNLRHWRLPVIEVEAFPEGTAYVGDFTQFILWDREQASIAVSDSHSDFFIRNLIAVLAEMRAAFGCKRPAAIVEIDVSQA
jgi:HK97 family phage major capsid protein